ncbi:MAG: hypothetical protein ACLFST_05015 [Spirochaetia bacterium]
MKIQVTLEIEVSLKDATLSDAKKIVKQIISPEKIEAVKDIDIKSVKLV